MPLLIKSGESVTHDEQVFLPLEQWLESRDQGLMLEVDDEPQAEFAEAPAIAVNFGAFNDGRGLSLAVLLRTRLNYTGDLRAVGDVHHDLVHYLVRCGYSSFELDERRDLNVALKGAAIHANYYQGSVKQPAPLKKVA